MVLVQKWPTPYLSNASSSQVDVMHRLGWFTSGHNRRAPGCVIRSENVTDTSTSSYQDRLGRRQFLAVGPTIAPLLLMTSQTPTSFAAENKKGFLPVTDKKDKYSFLYPFGWQVILHLMIIMFSVGFLLRFLFLCHSCVNKLLEKQEYGAAFEVVVEGEDKVFKDVIEPLESVSVNVIPSSKEDIRDFGSPQQVAEILIKKFLASPSQKTKLIEASERDVDGKTYYTFEFTAQAPNYARHALTVVCVGNGKFYTLTTGAKERRWEKMKDRLHTVVDSFQISNV